MLRRTKLLATLGPASSSESVLRQLVEAGIDACSFNLSNFKPVDAESLVSSLRGLSAEAGRPVALQLEIQGPRLGVRESWEELKSAMRLGVDCIALSSVRKAGDVLAPRGFLEERGFDIPIVSRIETREAVANADEIIAASDGISLSMGNLGVEVGYQEVPPIQSFFVRRCQAHGKMVQVGGEVMDTMASNPGPTRSECVDVANAVLQGVDVVSLSRATAVGTDPVQAAKALDRIVRRAEVTLGYYEGTGDVEPLVLERFEPVRELMLSGVDALLVEDEELAAAIALSRARPRCPVLIVAQGRKANWLNSWWGVYPVSSLAAARRSGLLPPDSRVLTVSIADLSEE